MKETTATGVTAIIAGIVTTLLGGWDKVLEILMIVMFLDYLTGITGAFMTKTLRSSIGYEGLLKKGSMFLVVILAAQVDKLTGNTNAVFRTCTTFFFIANESLSIIENARKIGIEFPVALEKFIQRFKQLHHDPDYLQDQMPDAKSSIPISKTSDDSSTDHTQPPTA